jgi:hypothetical protein
MTSDGPRIPPTGVGPGTLGPARPREQGPRSTAAVRPPPVRRFFVDPHDIEAAIERLTRLLAADTDGPRMDVPPGFYLNIFV